MNFIHLLDLTGAVVKNTTIAPLAAIEPAALRWDNALIAGSIPVSRAPKVVFFRNCSKYLPDYTGIFTRTMKPKKCFLCLFCVKRRFFCMLRNTRSKLMRIIYHLRL